MAKVDGCARNINKFSRPEIRHVCLSHLSLQNVTASRDKSERDAEERRKKKSFEMEVEFSIYLFSSFVSKLPGAEFHVFIAVVRFL